MKNFKKITLGMLAGIVAIGSVAYFNNENKLNSLAQASSEKNITIIEDEKVPLAKNAYSTKNTVSLNTAVKENIPASTPPVSTGIMPKADGKTVYKNDRVSIDASNITSGYVMISFNGSSTKKLKVIVTGPSQVKYTYNISANGKYETFPLSDGNGSYNVGIFENIEGNKYAQVFGQKIEVKLENEFAPFLLPNQYVNYTENSSVVTKAKELVSNKKTDLDRIASVYNFVVTTLKYDKERAVNVKDGYLPNVDNVLAEKKGICFDYAALMTSMLRSQGIPCKLVVGYAGTSYHAWINAYTKENGWVDNVIMFDGKNWKLMDPTFASSGKNNPEILKFIGDGKNYSAKFLY